VKGFLIRRWDVTVQHWGNAVILAVTRGKALANAWRSDAFEGYSFKEFLGMARCRLSETQLPAVPITVGGEPAFYIDHNRAYVEFVRPGSEHVRSAHPYDVLPERCRPLAYRTSPARLQEEDK